MKKPENVEEYISGFPEDVQKHMQRLRKAIKEAAPEAKETIGYAIATYKLNGNLVHFAAYKKHIGFYPGPTGIAHFKEELSAYKGAKGSVQFQLNQEIPLELISRIVKFRVSENS